MRRILQLSVMAVVAVVGVSCAKETAREPATSAAPPVSAVGATEAGRATNVKLFFVALDDAGKSGREIGCKDSLVAVERQLSGEVAGPAAAVRELLSLHDRMYGQSGLYNALAASSLQAQDVSVQGGVATVKLTGAVKVNGACDAPRIDAQLVEVVRQFPEVSSVSVLINDRPLAEVLSAR